MALPRSLRSLLQQQQVPASGPHKPSGSRCVCAVAVRTTAGSQACAAHSVDQTQRGRDPQVKRPARAQSVWGRDGSISAAVESYASRPTRKARGRTRRGAAPQHASSCQEGGLSGTGGQKVCSSTTTLRKHVFSRMWARTWDRKATCDDADAARRPPGGSSCSAAVREGPTQCGRRRRGTLAGKPEEGTGRSWGAGSHRGTARKSGYPCRKA